MCGIVGIVGKGPVNQDLYDALIVLQHRGQDAAGIMTINDGMFHLRKENGLVRDVFRTRHMKRLSGSVPGGRARRHLCCNRLGLAEAAQQAGFAIGMCCLSAVPADSSWLAVRAYDGVRDGRGS